MAVHCACQPARAMRILDSQWQCARTPISMRPDGCWLFPANGNNYKPAVLKSAPKRGSTARRQRPLELLAIPLAIVRARAADLSLVARLAREIWHRHYPGIISTAQIDYMLARGYSRDALAQYLDTPDAGLALAKRDDDCVGFVGWYRIDASEAMKLDKLYVLPEHQGAGIGRALIEHVVARADAAGCTSVSLNVNRANVKAVRAYERCGFAIRERGDFPIGNGFVMEDFIMVRAV
jgi:ribosomal protein S18 acetylase RimI-like enzyme